MGYSSAFHLRVEFESPRSFGTGMVMYPPPSSFKLGSIPAEGFEPSMDIPPYKVYPLCMAGRPSRSLYVAIIQPALNYRLVLVW